MVRPESCSGGRCPVLGWRWVFGEAHVEENFDPDEVQEFHQPRPVPSFRERATLSSAAFRTGMSTCLIKRTPIRTRTYSGRPSPLKQSFLALPRSSGPLGRVPHTPRTPPACRTGSRTSGALSEPVSSHAAPGPSGGHMPTRSPARSRAKISRRFRLVTYFSVNSSQESIPLPESLSFAIVPLERRLSSVPRSSNPVALLLSGGGWVTKKNITLLRPPRRRFWAIPGKNASKCVAKVPGRAMKPPRK